MERIIVDPHIHFGKPIIKGTRITVQNVLELIKEGLTFDQILRDYYPDLKKDDILAYMQYPGLSDSTTISSSPVSVLPHPIQHFQEFSTHCVERFRCDELEHAQQRRAHADDNEYDARQQASRDKVHRYHPARTLSLFV